jgi:hypothetical protein
MDGKPFVDHFFGGYLGDMASDKLDLEMKASKMAGQTATATAMQDVRQTQTLRLLPRPVRASF